MQELNATWQLVAQELEGAISRAVAGKHLIDARQANVARDCSHVLVSRLEQMQPSHERGNVAVGEGVFHLVHYVAKARMRAAVEDCEASVWRVVKFNHKAYLVRKPIGPPAASRSQQHAVAFPFARESWG